ncbi:hypothetical protein ABZV41_34850 [Streptomyces sp. NPDC005098]|uniref:hypothetical protein n=1 Tax=Streptomyces sp. NPDC005098 TaxID=3154560 RepID=UPI0033B147BB
MRTALLDPAEEQGVVSLLLEMRWAERAVDPMIRLTWSGVTEAREVRARSQSRAGRDQYLHNVLPRWAYESARSGDWVSLQMFAADEQWWYCGAEMTWREVKAAVDYLEAKGILHVQRAPGPTHIAPTAEGIDFVLSKEKLRIFMTNQRPPAQVSHSYHNSNVVNGDAPGSNLATGGGNTQTVNQGIDAQGLAALVAQLREIAPNLGLSHQDAEDFNQEIDELEQEGADPERGGRIFRRLLRMVPPELVAAGTDQGLAATIAFGTSLFGG